MKPVISKKESLEEIVEHLEEEARMVLPGIQALFGFQLIAVFNNRFDGLSDAAKWLHLVSLCCTTLSILFVLTPAAYHRQAEPNSISTYFCQLGSTLLTVSMLPLAAAISLDLDVILQLAVGATALAHTAGILSFALFSTFWFIFPRVAKRKAQT